MRAARRSANPLRMWSQIVLLVSLTSHCTSIISHQQLSPANQGSEHSSSTAAHLNQQKASLSGSSIASNLQKVGLAPHDRPACQLPPITAQRRHSNTSSSGQTQQAALLPVSESRAADSSSEKAAPSNGTATLRSLSTPTLVALQSTGGQSGNKNPFARAKFDSSERLRQLRQLLASNNYDAYLVTPNDEHGSEYVTDYDKRLRFISGFTGSNGFALILLDRAVLFTDGRYAIQADQDLDCNWWLVVSDEPLVDIHLWLRANAAKGIKIATDARLMSLQNFDYLDDQIKKLDSEFALITQDLVDVVWNNAGDLVAVDRVPPQEPIFVHPLQFAGNLSWQEKMVKLADSMNKLRARHYVVSQLDDIAWLLNLRGADIPMTPLFKAYLFISRTGEMQLASSGQIQQPGLGQLLSSTSSSIQQSLQAPQVLQVQPNQVIRVTLYVDLKKVGQQVREHLHTENGTIIVHHVQQDPAPGSVGSSSMHPVTTRIQVELKDYDVFIMDLRDRLSGARQIQGRLLLNAGANVAIHVLAKAYEDRLVLAESLINKLKAVRSDGEVQGMRLAHWRDSLAICMLLSQLETDIGQKGLVNRWTEVSAAKELEFYRSLMDHNKGQSFDTISAYGANAAVVHYRPDPQEYRSIGNQSTYLLDSGGQYLDGTTDITRTTHYGEPTEFQRETYTRVLMGAVDMMSLIFDQSHRAPYRLNDLLARRHLFEIGLDYAHGTGHGIGPFSLVHEQPYLLEHYTTVAQQRQANANKATNQPLVHSEPVPLQANMFTSVEPGYYRANDFGIRLENIVVTQRVNLPAALSRPNDRQEPSTRASSASQGERQFLRFEPISLVPFEPKLIKLELLSNKQKAWLNSYNLMVRLRMTQQINYYLEKIRNLHSQPVQAQGVASSNSRLYQQLLKPSSQAQTQQRNPSVNHSTELNQIQIGHYNFIRLDGAKFQEKLEQTHKWMMSKTELIPLDVDQSLVVGGGGGKPGGPANAQACRSQAGRRDGDEASSVLGQKLMLAYMSSLPFNDARAAEAISELNSDESQLSSRSENATTRSGDSIPTVGSSVSSNISKCVGLECDLWLVDALNPQSRQQHREHKVPKTWPPMQTSSSLDSFFPGSSSSSSSLMDLFQLNGTNNQFIQINMWSLIALASLVVIQLSVLAYMCRNSLWSPATSQPVAG